MMMRSIAFLGVVLAFACVACSNSRSRGPTGVDGGGGSCGGAVCGTGQMCCQTSCGGDRACMTTSMCPLLGCFPADAGGDLPDTGTPPGVMCSMGSIEFPVFDKTCTTVDDCAFGIHHTDCCGNTIAIGFTASQRATFDAAEAACVSMLPDCDCPSGPTVAEDGMTTPDPLALFVWCTPEHRCMTGVAMAAP